MSLGFDFADGDVRWSNPAPTVDYGPFLKSQLVPTQLTLQLMWCRFGHVSPKIRGARNLRSPPSGSGGGFRSLDYVPQVLHFEPSRILHFEPSRILHFEPSRNEGSTRACLSGSTLLTGTCAGGQAYLTQSVFKVVCRSQLPHKSVNLSFTITNIKNKSTDLCGN